MTTPTTTNGRTSGATGKKPRDNAKLAAVSGFVGSALEYYDFFIYAAAAALIFSHVFFPEGNAALGTLLSIATVGVAYVTRPLGAILWGHIGDRVGRKKALMACLLIMGVSTFLVGLIPSYGTIGIAAPILVVLIRLVQGLSAGGESPGSASLTLEHAPERRRAFFTSWTISGVTFGIVLSTLVFIPVSALPDDALYAWGWRIPFLLSAVVTCVALLLRRLLEEPEVFVETKENAQVVKAPIVTLFRHDALTVIRVAAMSLFTLVNTIVSVFVLAYATSVGGVDRTAILWIITITNMMAVITTPLWGMLSDRIGRKPVYLIGLVLQMGLVFGLLWASSTGDLAMLWLFAVLLVPGAYTMSNSIYPAYFPEQFKVHIRYSGMAVSLMIGLLAAGFAPMVAQLIIGADTANWLGVAGFVVVVIALGGIACLFSPETYRTPTALLGRTRAEQKAADEAEAIRTEGA